MRKKQQISYTITENATGNIVGLGQIKAEEKENLSPSDFTIKAEIKKTADSGKYTVKLRTVKMGGFASQEFDFVSFKEKKKLSALLLKAV